MIRRYLLALIFSIIVLTTGCTYYPYGMSEYSDYVEMMPNVGILARTEGRAPILVLSQQYGIQLLIDERILGSWLLQGSNVPNISLSSDGTATTTTPSLFTRNGQFLWMTGNIILIEYDDGTYDMMRFDMMGNDVALINIWPHDSAEGFSVFAVKVGADESTDSRLASLQR